MSEFCKINSSRTEVELHLDNMSCATTRHIVSPVSGSAPRDLGLAGVSDFVVILVGARQRAMYLGYSTRQLESAQAQRADHFG